MVRSARQRSSGRHRPGMRRTIALLPILLIASLSASALALAINKTGTPGPDTLTGTPGPDRLHGRGGDDRIYGGAGNDIIVGGPGRDVIVAGDGDDTIRVRDGRRDVVSCGSGRDRVIADAVDQISRDCEHRSRR